MVVEEDSVREAVRREGVAEEGEGSLFASVEEEEEEEEEAAAES